VLQKMLQKSAPSDASQLLFTGQAAPREAGSRAQFSNEKQLVEQQLKHCSKFLQKKWNGLEINVKIDCCWNNWMDCCELSTVDAKSKANIET